MSIRPPRQANSFADWRRPFRFSPTFRPFEMRPLAPIGNRPLALRCKIPRLTRLVRSADPCLRGTIPRRKSTACNLARTTDKRCNTESSRPATIKTNATCGLHNRARCGGAGRAKTCLPRAQRASPSKFAQGLAPALMQRAVLATVATLLLVHALKANRKENHKIS